MSAVSTAPARLPEWKAWIGRITVHVIILLDNRSIYRGTLDIYDKNQVVRDNAYFFDWTARNYAVAQAIGVRRLVDKRDDVVSFYRLLTDIRDHAASVTWSWFQAAVGGVPGAPRAFKRWDPNGLGHIDPAVIEKDLAGLHALATPVRRYVNKHLAHLDAKGANVKVTYRDLDAAIDGFDKLLYEYHTLVSQGMVSTALATPDWRALFRALPLIT